MDVASKLVWRENTYKSLGLLSPPFAWVCSQIYFDKISYLQHQTGELWGKESGGLQGKDKQLKTKEGRRALCDAQIAKSGVVELKLKSQEM